ncbi:GNAT family N-acetyltransferase [Natronobeatus ordinarius]|uniref:GNAT family N-acetyltransferase n=1 Tax=Natronobeatus ordinarius TaxID=2963433 RepID=UPI0020CFC89C|nr:GNAT family N-acetyltransferase [Natronobeatus ordinarius]
MSDVNATGSNARTAAVEIERCDDDGRWDDLLDRTARSTVFHRSVVLSALERHSAGTVHRLVGADESGPVGVCPLFELSKGGLTAVFTPPPRRGILFQGPLVFDAPTTSRETFGRRNERFVAACLDWIATEIGPSYERLCPTTEYVDVRPFERRGYAVCPQYTYVVDLSRDPDSLKRSFSRTPRRNIEARRTDVEIGVGDADDIRFIHRQVQNRYEAQGKAYTVPVEFLLELYEQSPEPIVTPYVGSLDGERKAGLIALFDETTAYFSEGGATPDAGVPFNDHLHWRVMCDAKSRGLSAYDLQGANTPRICAYKSKFNPEVRTYYEIESGTLVTSLASKLYRKLR